MNDDLNIFNLERRSIKEKVDAGEMSAENAIKSLKDVENREIAFKKAESEKAITSLAEDTMQKMKQTAQEVEQRMLSINIQASPKKETRQIEAIKTAFVEKRDITVGLPELGGYDVVQEVFSAATQQTPLLSRVRTYSVPSANMVFPIISSLSGIEVPSGGINYNDPKTKSAKTTANANENSIITTKATISLTSKLIQPKLNVGFQAISWEALNQGAIRSDDQLVPAFTDAFNQIIDAGVVNGNTTGFAGILQETIDASHIFKQTAQGQAAHWTQLVNMATVMSQYINLGASIVMSAGYKAMLINEGIGVSGGHFLAQELASNSSILGVPVVVDGNMAYNTTNDQTVAVGYPLSDYGIVYTNSMTFTWKDGVPGDTNKYLEATLGVQGSPVVGGQNMFAVKNAGTP